MIKKTLLLNWLTLVILISGCGITGELVEQKISVVVQDIGQVENVYFCPREDCGSVLEEFILGGEESVHCSIYDLDLENVIAALDSQYNKGLDVKLIVDTDNFEFVEHLDFVEQDNRSSIMHNKFCIVDNKRISSGSMNPTVNGNEKNNNNLIILESRVVAENYEDEFIEMWNGVYGKGDKTKKPIVYLNETKVEVYFCPEDSCGERIEEALSEAEESIYFLTFSFTHTGVANEIVKKLHDGVEVKGVFEKRGAGTEYSRFKLLEYQGADVRKDTNGATMHHKVFIIDNKTVVTGSFNPSQNADTRNDENILIIHDSSVASRYLEEFLYVWENFS
ncbi:MAG: phospholipase D-like domain-containing protein [Candidatus Woesearchaeota archaeon]